VLRRSCVVVQQVRRLLRWCWRVLTWVRATGIQAAINPPNFDAQTSATTEVERGAVLSGLRPGLAARSHTVPVVDINSGLQGIEFSRMRWMQRCVLLGSSARTASLFWCRSSQTGLVPAGLCTTTRGRFPSARASEGTHALKCATIVD
jgi:hypothetical protein